MAEPQRKRIFISALEPSAEAHCANLIGAVNQTCHPQTDWPGTDRREIPLSSNQPELSIEWTGLGGPQMTAAGCTLLENTVRRAAMIYNVFGQLGYYHRLRNTARDWLAAKRPDLVIVCDSPAFNFHIAKAAKKLDIPVLFYVAPQLWAWAPWRIGKLRRCCDRLACILPFEPEWFTPRGVRTEFVGNPLFDELSYNPDTCYKSYADYQPHAPKIALLPGSRKHELDTLWPVMQTVAAELLKKHPRARFFAAAADEEKQTALKQSQSEGLSIEYQVGGVFDLSGRVDFALVTSGSATLQVAAAGCPMAVLYQSSKFLWHLLGRHLVRTRFLSLVNILAGREVVPEFMPYLPPTAEIVRICGGMLDNKLGLTQTSSALVDLTRPFAKTRACENTAQIVLQMLEHEKP